MVAMQFNLAYIAYSKARKKHSELLNQGVTLVQEISKTDFDQNDAHGLHYLTQANELIYTLQDALFQIEFLDKEEAQIHCHDHCACLDEHDRIINLLYTAQNQVMTHMRKQQETASHYLNHAA